MDYILTASETLQISKFYQQNDENLSNLINYFVDRYIDRKTMSENVDPAEEPVIFNRRLELLFNDRIRHSTNKIITSVEG